MEARNKFGVVVFIIIIFTFIFGGYYLMLKLTNDSNTQKELLESEKQEYIDLRIDKSKDYVYFENSIDALPSEEFHFYDAIININTMNDINIKLKNEMDSIRKSIKYDKDVEMPEDVVKNPEGIYSLEYRDYDVHNYKNYISLVVKDYEYNIINKSNPIGLESYVINKETGERIGAEDLLLENNLTMDQVKEMIRKRLNDTQVLSGEETVIKTDETINNMSIFTIYINKKGNLEITFVVKTLESNYNDSIELN